MSRRTTWTNDDGLVVGFGTHSADNEVASVFQGANGVVTLVQEIDVASIVAFASESSIAYPNASGQEHVIPRGSVIQPSFLQTLIVATGSTADMDIGGWSRGLDTEVVDNFDGFQDQLLVAELALVGDTYAMDGDYINDPHAGDAGSGVAIGSISDSDVVVTYSYATVYTAGRIRVVINYVPPTGSAGDTLAVTNS